MAHFTAISIADRNAAEDYAAELIKQYRENSPADEARPEIVLAHLGDAVPAPLRWVILRLEAEQIPNRLLLLTADELERTLRDGQEKAEQLVLVKTGGAADESISRVRDLGEKSRLFLKQLYGLPQGMTLWFFDFPALGLKKSPMLRTAAERRKELGNATFQSLVAGASIWATFYVKEGTFLTEGALGIPAFVAWVWVWTYNARSWGSVMAQGKSLKEVTAGDWQTRNGDLYYYTNAYVRGVITNAIVMSCFFHGDVFHWQTLGVALTNAAVNLFARSWIDKWITDKQATILPDGKVEQREGQHSPTATIHIRFWWEFGYGILKNLQLIGYSNVVDGVYLTLGAIGLSKKLYGERYSLVRGLRNLRNTVSGNDEREKALTPGPLASLRICEAAFE